MKFLHQQQQQQQARPLNPYMAYDMVCTYFSGGAENDRV